jgi:ATP-dependent DNA helicase RecQ
MLALCETVDCRRSQLLNYFGETSGACGNCDTCLAPPQSWDGTIAAQKLLSAVLRLKRERNQKFGAGHITDILLGRKTPRVIDFDHASLTVFGVGEELSEAEWRGVVRQLLARGLLAVEGNYGTLVLTPESGDVLGGRRQVMLRREPEKPKRAATVRAKAGSAAGGGAAVAQLSGEDEALFQKLRAWRGATAKELGLPAYVIFHDATLRQIATARPGSLAGLAGISGVGESKLAKYGPGVLGVLGVLGGGDGPGGGGADEAGGPEWPDEPPPDLFD